MLLFQLLTFFPSLSLSLTHTHSHLTKDTDLATYNWDHPNSIDFDKFVHTIESLRKGKKVELSPNPKLPPEERKTDVTSIYGADVLIIIGTLVLYDPRLRNLMDITVFLDSDDDSCLIRRVRRDCFKREKDYRDVLKYYLEYVKPGYNSYILPTKRYAKIIVPFSGSFTEDDVAITLLSQFISSKLLERDLWDVGISRDVPSWTQLPSQVHLMPSTHQILSMQTILRNEKTTLEDFIFHTDRLTRLLIEYTLDAMVTDHCDVVTPTESVYHGVSLNYGNLCAVSIMRAGEALENAIREVIKDIKIGKMLIQSVNKAPRLFYCNLRHILAQQSKVILLDATLATGATVRMAVRVLLDHGVAEKDIYFVTLIASPQGIHSVLSVYSNIHIFTSAIDETLDENFYLSPGIGNFGDRYFGT